MACGAAIASYSGNEFSCPWWRNGGLSEFVHFWRKGVFHFCRWGGTAGLLSVLQRIQKRSKKKHFKQSLLGLGMFSLCSLLFSPFFPCVCVCLSPPSAFSGLCLELGLSQRSTIHLLHLMLITHLCQIKQSSHLPTLLYLRPAQSSTHRQIVCYPPVVFCLASWGVGALAWAEAKFSWQTVEGIQFSDFMEEFKLVFDHPDYVTNASIRLMTLSQDDDQ